KGWPSALEHARSTSGAPRCSIQPGDDAASRLVEGSLGIDAAGLEIYLRGDSQHEPDDHRREAGLVDEVAISGVQNAPRALAIHIIKSRVRLACLRIRAQSPPEREQDDARLAVVEEAVQIRAQHGADLLDRRVALCDFGVRRSVDLAERAGEDSVDDLVLVLEVI